MPKNLMTKTAYTQDNDRVDSTSFSAGLRGFMIHVYNLMAGSLAVTAMVAFALASMMTETTAAGATSLTPLGNTLLNSGWKWALLLAPLPAVLVLTHAIDRISEAAAKLLLWSFAGLMGASLSGVFLVYSMGSIMTTFLVSSVAFGGLSLWAYTTERDISGFGSFLIMGLWGLIAAMVVNLFLGSSTMDFVICAAGVLIFAGLTAYDTQDIKNSYLHSSGGNEGALAIHGALRLYLDFINLFLMLLRFMGVKKG